MPNPSTPPAYRIFALYAWIGKIIILYVLLIPAALAALFLFSPRMPDVESIYDSAGPFAIVLLARPLLITGSMYAFPAALLLSFFKARRTAWVVIISYLALAAIWIAKRYGA